MLWKPDRLRFGPAGIPHRAKSRTTKHGIIEVKAIGLDAMEIEFVRKIGLTDTTARDVRTIARNLDVALTVHAPYYINLASPDKDKVEASVRRIYQSAVIGNMAGAWSVCFHAAYYMGRSSEKVYRLVKEVLVKLVKSLQDQGIEIWLRPETTGASSEFGDLNELLKLCSELEMILPVVDFAHLHARSGGLINSYEEFSTVLTTLENALGSIVLENMHIHVSGIQYNEKGEVKHLNLKDSDLRYEELMKTLWDFKIKGVLICESPNLEEDATLLKNTYERFEKHERRARPGS
ncbi:MAG: TIM barrel protein [Thermofilaceae archaeon]|nr:TIM barrel protein [Thermofilaceae archaeon]